MKIPRCSEASTKIPVFDAVCETSGCREQGEVYAWVRGESLMCPGCGDERATFPRP